MLVLLTVLLALLTRLLVLLGAGAWGVAIHWALLLFEALIHEAGDEAEGRQEDEQQYDSNHARAGHSLTFAAPHLQRHPCTDTSLVQVCQCAAAVTLLCSSETDLWSVLHVMSDAPQWRSRKVRCPHLGGVDFVVDNVLAGRWLHQWRLYRYPWYGSGVCRRRGKLFF